MNPRNVPFPVQSNTKELRAARRHNAVQVYRQAGHSRAVAISMAKELYK